MTTFIRTQEIEHEIGDRGRFTLRVIDPDVEMRAADGRTARVRVTFEIRADSDAAADEIFERSRYRVNEGGGSLEVAEPEHDASGAIGSLARIFGGARRPEAAVEVTAPPRCDLRYDGVSADLTASGFTGSQEYRTVSGDLVLDRAGGSVRIKGVSSDISLRADARIKHLDINTVSGDVSAVAPGIGQMRAATISGDIELEGILDDGPQHRVETVSGDLSLGVAQDLTIEVRGLSSDADVRLPHRTEGSRDRRRYVIGSGKPQLLFSSMSGDVEVRSPRRTTHHPRPPAPPARPSEPSDQLAILQALEAGEIDVDEAARRLAGGSSNV
ncbi:MAG: DUF4097 family beta strand repeat-containing protein [Candidatus Limnocylindria bacterium]